MTILALVILFAIYAFMDAGLETMRAFGSGRAGPVIGHLLLGLVDLGAGVIALAWPAPTALVLVLVVGLWALFGGFFEIFSAFGPGESAGHRAMYLITGVVWVVFGLFSLISGATLITRGIDVRWTGRALDPVGARA